MRYVLLFLSFRASAVSATPLQSTDDQTIGLSTALNLTGLDLLVPSNASTEDLDASNAGSLRIHCDGETYGFNPSLADCEGARSYIPPESEQYTFGDRHTGLPEYVFPLPFMIMGGTLKKGEKTPTRSLSDTLCIPDKAECFFQTINIGDGPTGRASLNQVRTAASALLLRCALNEPSQGGIVTRIGKTQLLKREYGVVVCSFDRRRRQQHGRDNGRLQANRTMSRQPSNRRFLQGRLGRYACIQRAGSLRSTERTPCQRDCSSGSRLG